MSRNGSGAYSVVNTFVAGATITAAGHNQNWSDIAAEMTNSVAADGQTTMTGPLKAASGTVAAPGITFGSDTDSGIYRIGSNNLGVAVNGAKVLDVATTGATVTGDLEASGSVKQNGFSLLPVGLGPLPWSGLSAPTGWVFAAGQSLSRTTYAALWAFAQTEIAGSNTLYGAGDGSTTFTVADMRGRIPAGKTNMGGVLEARLTSTTMSPDSTALGAVGGAESITLTSAQLPANIPNSASSTFTSTNSASVGTTLNLDVAGSPGVTILRNFTTFTPTGTVATTVTINASGGSAHPNVQPTIITNYIIFAGV
jgi:microcystin-dependent protein